MTLQVESPTVYTSQGVPISVTGIAQVKIQGQNEDMLLVSFVVALFFFLWKFQMKVESFNDAKLKFSKEKSEKMIKI